MNTKKQFRNMLVITLAIAFATTTGLSACGGGKGGDNAAQKLLESVPFTKEGLVSMIKSTDVLTETEYEALILAYSKCEIDQVTLKLKENPVSAAKSEIRKTHKNPADEIVNAIQVRLLTHESPQVRGYIIEGVRTLLGVTKENRQAVLDMLKNEKELYVINKGINVLSNEMKDPDVAAIIFAHAKHEHPIIRRSVAGAIGNSWSAGVSGTTEAIIELMNDKDQEVRGTACGNSGKLGDETVIAELVKILNNPAEAKIHGKCIDGLCTLCLIILFTKKQVKLLTKLHLIT